MLELFRRLYFLVNRRRLDNELANDMAVHREMLGADARTSFGNPTLLQEKSREAWGWGWLERFMQDVRYGFRMLKNNPGFTLVAILALGLGIGANTALFSMVYGILLKPLPYAQGQQLMVIQQTIAKTNDGMGFSAKDIQDYRKQTRAFSLLEEYHGMGFILLDGQEPTRVKTGVVSAHYFDMLGIKPYLGRLFNDADETKQSDAVLVLSYPYWKDHYGGDINIIGRHFRMNDKVHTVIGVLPPVPQYPRENDVYMPTVACPSRSSPMMMEERDHRMVALFGRLKPGETLQSGGLDLALITARLQKEYPESYPPQGSTVSLKSLHARLTQDVRPALLILLGTAGLVLLIACANVANLALARMMRREQELAVRAALGASRGRLIRQLLTESTLLSLGGGLLGLFLASQCMALLISFAQRFTTRAAEVSISMPVLLFTLGLSVATGIIFGSAPAFSQRISLVTALKDGSNSATSKSNGNRLRNLLAVGQVALSFMLLIGAGLMIRSFIKLQHIDAGYNGDHVLTANIPLNFSKYTKNQDNLIFFDRLKQILEASPGIRAVAFNSGAPLAPGSPMRQEFDVQGRATDNLSKLVTSFEVATPDTFQLLGVPVVAGRAFTSADKEGAPPVAILSRAAAQHYFGGEDPLNKRIPPDKGKNWLTIVGVVGDVKQFGLDRDPVDTTYVPEAQFAMGNTILIKTAGDPMNYASQLRKAVFAIDKDQPVTDIKSLDELRGDSLAGTRITSILLALFAALALIIAATGLSGVTALLVSQRTREIGIRLALGAQRGEVLAMVVKQSMRVIFIGLGAGVVGALLTSRLLTSLLFKTPATDPLTFIGVAMVLLTVALAASYLPARRVTRVNPMIALRSE
jgi:putative ABC transport system permease protein